MIFVDLQECSALSLTMTIRFADGTSTSVRELFALRAEFERKVGLVLSKHDLRASVEFDNVATPPDGAQQQEQPPNANS